jgi:hypothetical protein
MQWLSTDVMRHQFRRDFFLRRLRDTIATHAATFPVVVSDVRFEDEARLIRDLGGVVVRVSHRTRESHESENGTFPCDHELQNHRTVADLHAQVDLLVVATPPPPQPSPLTVDAP